MTFKTFADGDILYAAELNANFLRGKIVSTYTGNGFDSSSSVANDHTLTLTSGQLDNATYLLISVSVWSELSRTAASSDFSSTIRLERSVASAASWSDIMAAIAVGYERWDNGNVARSYGGGFSFIPLVVTLTAGEKAGGIDIKITAYSDTSIVNKIVIFQIAD